MQPSPTKPTGDRRLATGGLLALTLFHTVALLLWATLRALTADHLFPVALVTIFAAYAFLPLILTVWPPIVILLTRPTPALRRAAALTLSPTFAALTLALALFGDLFTPPMPTATQPGTTLRVLTYNVEGGNADPGPVLAVIQAANPDLIGLQELNPRLAAALAPTLNTTHPYQLLAPQESVFGMGLYSRYPFTPLDTPYDSEWIGIPQTVVLDINGQPVLWINAHFMVTNPALGAGLLNYYRTFQWTHRERERNAQQIADVITSQPHPALLTADLNATDLSAAYSSLTAAGLVDSWRVGGFGLGHTFPQPGYGLVPPRLVRIDHILATPPLTPLTALRLPADGQSDHYPVLATLSLP